MNCECFESIYEHLVNSRPLNSFEMNYECPESMYVCFVDS